MYQVVDGILPFFSETYPYQKKNNCEDGNDLIKKLNTEITIDDDDFEPLLIENIERRMCKKCLQTSGGTLNVISHLHYCKYNEKNNELIYDDGCHVNYNYKEINDENSLCVLQGEYGTLNKNNKQKYIYSFGKDSHIILCMRNNETNETMLAHIDALTTNYLMPFMDFDVHKTDVYVIGGDVSSKNMVKKLVNEVNSHGFKIKYAKIFTNTIDDFVIDTSNGTINFNFIISEEIGKKILERIKSIYFYRCESNFMKIIKNLNFYNKKT